MKHQTAKHVNHCFEPKQDEKMLHLKTFEVHMNFIKVAKLLGLITLFGTQQLDH